VTSGAFDHDAALRVWSEGDHGASLSPADHRTVDATSAIRATIVDFARRADHDEELYDACAVLGRLLAEGGGSASLAATSMDHACQALGDLAPAWAPAARAAVAEGYTRALLERVREAGDASWNFPACAVRLDASTIAIAAGHPSDDDETLADWAGRAARDAARDGVRRAFIAGPERSRSALAEALAIVGIDYSER
jgi:hypothetical protein